MKREMTCCNSKGFETCFQFERLRKGFRKASKGFERLRNSHGFLRCSRSYSRIQGSVPVLGLQLNEFSRSLLVCARTHPPISTHTKVRVSFCLLGKWYGKVVFYTVAGAQSRNSHGLLRCSRSYSRIHGSDAGPCAGAA